MSEAGEVFKYINSHELHVLAVSRTWLGLMLVVNIVTLPTCRIVNIVIVPTGLATLMLVVQEN